MNRCDLHTHSTFSDGTFTPTQLISEAERIGLDAIALCDHNTIAGLPEFISAAEGRGVEAIAGVEFSTEYSGTELHILGLFIRPEHYSSVNEKLMEYAHRKDVSNRELIEKLHCKGYHLDYDSIKAASPNGNINRAHIAAELTKLGYTSSIKEAFKTLLSPSCGYYTPPQRLDAFETIRFIKSIGAVAVIAHPFLNLSVPSLRVFLEKAKPCGLDGMETLYSLYSDETTLLAKQIAREFSLLESGGSDFHGDNKPDISLGVGKGNLIISTEYLKKLRQAL